MSRGLLLLVDDTVNNLKVLSDCLLRNGYEVRCATSGDLALQALAYILPDLILLDIRMPGMDGFETCLRIKDMARTREIPVIFISAMQELEERVRAFAVGGVDFVTKPFQEQEVLARVGAHVALYQARRQLQGLLQSTSDAYAAFQRRMEVLFAVMDDSIGIFQERSDSGYELVECNPAFSRMVGVPREQLLGVDSAEIFRDNRKDFLPSLAAQLPGSPDLQLPLQSFGFRKYYRSQATLLAPGMVALVSSDVSDLVQAQEDLEVRNQEVEGVLYILSHDLRSPLVNIQGFSKVLSEELEDSCVRENPEKLEVLHNALHTIGGNVLKMDRMIRSLAQFARTGRLTVKMERLDVAAILRALLHSEQEAWKVYGDYRIDWDLLEPCMGDKVLLESLWRNLLTNALQYAAPERAPRIKITAQPSGDTVIYCLQDNGRGIPPRHLQRVWDLFYRGDCTSNSGEGLGLAVVKKMTEKMHGKVWLESTEGTGTRVYLELKCAPGG